MREQVKWRMAEASPVAESLNELIKQNSKKAEASGINLVLGFPASIVEDMDEQIEGLKRLIGTEDETE